MRLLLDADLSHRYIGRPLTRQGHDVLSLQKSPALSPLADPEVLELAAAQRRILVTRNARDFDPIARDWASSDRRHAGLILVWSLRSDAFGEIVSGVERLVAEHPAQADWINLVLTL
jgi:hypothetical protein